MLNPFTYIIHSITPSQPENGRYSLLAGIYTASLRTDLSIEMISDFIFINRNRTESVCNTPIDVFGVSLDAMADIVGATESNPYDFADASETE